LHFVGALWRRGAIAHQLAAAMAETAGPRRLIFTSKKRSVTFHF
jgi:hypothetical protein